MPDSHVKGGYSVVKSAINSPPKIGFLKRAVRFFGFSKIQVVKSSLTNPRGAVIVGTSLKERVVESISDHLTPEKSPLLDAEWMPPKIELNSVQRVFEGYRANRTHITALKNEIISNNIGRKEGESGDLYDHRVRFSLVASGFANFGRNGELISRRYLNGSMSAKQFSRLELLLNASSEKLTTEVYSQKHVNKKWLLRDPVFCEMLGVSAGLGQFVHSREFYARQNLLCDYFTYGEGYALLEEGGYSQIGALPSAWPQYNKTLDAINDREVNDLEQINRYMRQGLRDGGTDGAVNEHGITWVMDDDQKTLQVEKLYETRNQEHRFLALLQEVSSANDGGYCQAMIVKYAANAGIPEFNERLDKIRGMKQVFSNIYSGAGHVIMKKAFPDDITETKYTRVVLKNSQGVFQWNSDLLQPRGGWKEHQDILVDSEGKRIVISR